MRTFIETGADVKVTIMPQINDIPADKYIRNLIGYFESREMSNEDLESLQNAIILELGRITFDVKVVQKKKGRHLYGDR